MIFPAVSIALLHGLGLMALIALCYGMVERTVPARRWRQWIEGIVFGCGAVGAMVTPAVVAQGIIVDARCVVIGLAAAFAGWRGAVSAALIAALYRIWIGGAGMPVGVGSIVVAALIGIVWGSRLGWGRQASLLHFAGLGAILSTHLAAFVFLPVADPLWLVLDLLPMVLPAYLIAALVMGSMMQRETRAIERESSLAIDALTDPLTGLANRRAYRSVIADEFSRRTVETAAITLLVVDIDHFKMVNDCHGHEVGDDVLKVISRDMRSRLSPRDFLFRHGGEEFCVVLSGADGDKGRQIAENLLYGIRKLDILVEGKRLALSVSIGLATVPENGINAAGLYASADSALYRAKNEGRDRICCAGDHPEPQGHRAKQPKTACQSVAPPFATTTQHIDMQQRSG